MALWDRPTGQGMPLGSQKSPSLMIINITVMERRWEREVAIRSRNLFSHTELATIVISIIDDSSPTRMKLRDCDKTDDRNVLPPLVHQQTLPWSQRIWIRGQLEVGWDRLPPILSWVCLNLPLGAYSSWIFDGQPIHLGVDL